MTHHDFDPSELLERLREHPDGDLVRSLGELVLQELIEAELTAHIGAGRHERSLARRDATDTVLGVCQRRAEISIYGSRSCAKARSFQACASVGVSLTTLSTPLSWRPT